MKLIAELSRRLRMLLRRQRFDREMDEEIRLHLEMREKEHAADGVSSEEAYMTARKNFGNALALREASHEAWGWNWLEQLVQDSRYGLRMLRKSPGFTVVAVLTLAVGIGANTAIFSVVNAVLLRPLPYPNHDRLVRIEEMHAGEPGANLTYATFLDLARESRTLTNVAAFRAWSFNITGEGEPEQVVGALISGDFFGALGSKPYLGRLIRAEDDAPGGNNAVTVLSYALWSSRYGGDRSVLGKFITVNAEKYAVIGVMPPGFDYPEKSEIWCPLVAGGSFHANRRSHLLSVIGDLPQVENLSSAQGELGALASRIDSENPGVDPGLQLTAVSLKRSMVAPVRPALVVLTIAVGLLLLIACANVANLFLARAAARRKEIAIRSALGAGRTRLARQLFTESVLLATLGGAGGLMLAAWSLRFIVAINGEDIPRLGETALDWHVLGFTVAVSLLTGVLFGFAPAATGTKLDLNSSLKEGVAADTGATRRRASHALVVTQLALAMVMLVGAGLLGGSFARLLRVNPGFNAQNLLTLQVFLSPIEYPERATKIAVTLREMLGRIRALPGVRAAGLVNSLPITGGVGTDFVLHDRPAPPTGNEPDADIRVADPGYFRTMGIPLLSGRNFSEQDTSDSARVVIINETMARTFWPHESPLGKRLTMKDWGPPLDGEIIGVAGDVKTNGLDAAVLPMIYWPDSQFPTDFNTFVVRADGDPHALASAVKRAIWAVDKDQPITRVLTMDEILSDSQARRRLYLTLLAVFAGAALLVAAVGIYGVVAYDMSQRTHEIGVRMALGAQRGDVMRMVIGQGAALAAIGIVIGIGAAFGLTRLMATMLYGVNATDPLTFAGVAIALLLVALAACYIPARRAMRVDPMVALRYE
ncbi:MAG TPA: ABC transporter permease [Candidatus Acidoferrales bacterium]|nr:ABC transporter permease [Candidatus Acidoferrales bacterium]